MAGDHSCLGKQFCIGQFPALAGFENADECRSIIAKAQEVLCKVQACIREPAGARKKLQVGNSLRGRLAGLNPSEVPDQLPEGGGLVDRPAVEIFIFAQVVATECRGGAAKTGQLGCGSGFPRRSPGGFVARATIRCGHEFSGCWIPLLILLEGGTDVSAVHDQD